MATSNPATNITENKAGKSASATADTTDLVKTILPFAVAILVQMPLIVLYYFWLYDRPHYSSWWFFALIATGGLIWLRWPKDGKQVFMDSKWSNALLIVALISGLLGVLFVEPWFATCSAFTLLMSLMARTIDRDTGRGLWTVGLPLFVSLAIPIGYDRHLITWLQSSSAHLTSRLLDLLNIAHYMPGTVIQVPGAEYGIEEACSGIQSFYLLVFVAVVLSVWLRRTFFRSVILVAAAVVWSVFMNCIRILLIPVFDINMDIDLAHGIQHDLLGWSTMALGILLLLSTDQFLMFLFGPVEVGTGSSGPMGKFITKVWNNLIAGEKENEESSKRKRSRRKALSGLSQGLAWAVAGILAAGGLMALWDIRSSFTADEHATVNFFNSKVVYPLAEASLPEQVKDWQMIPDTYKSENRSRSSDLGQQSDTWTYVSPNRFLAFLSLDQPFPGWHELTKCYQNQGWKLIDGGRQWRDWKEAESADGKEKHWPYIEAHFEKETGERAMVLFSLFDRFGEPFDPPKVWSFIPNLIHGATGRLGHRVRARLFQGSAYQTQVFVYGFGEISAEDRDEITDHYLAIREIMRSELTKKIEEDSAE